MTRERTTLRSHARLTLVVGVGLFAGLFGLASPVFADTSHFPILTGDQEVPGPGDPDGEGTAQVSFDVSNGGVCVSWDLVGIDAATAAHIHAGAAGVAGSVVATLPTPEADGTGGDCVSGLNSGDLQAIVNDPDSFYVNVHNDAFPDGAIRGQLGAPLEHFQLSIYVLGCSEGYEITPVFEGIPAGCRFVARPGDLPALPDGYSYDRDPILADLEFEVDDGATVLTLADAEFVGGSSCNTETLLCSAAGWYIWPLVFGGDTTVRQVGLPAGYELVGATLAETIDDGDVLGLSGPSSVTFDSIGLSSPFLAMYDALAGGPAATPAPTLPPTSIAPVQLDGPETTQVVLAPLLLAALAVLLGLTVRRPGRRH